jgi:hypothetical protein
VGEYYRADGDAAGLIAARQGGAWSAYQAPVPAGVPGTDTAGLSSVACADPTHCVAIGSYYDAATRKGGIMLLSGSGSSWTAVAAPLPAGAPNPGTSVQLNGLTCASSSSCVAVGYYYPSGATTPDDHGLVLSGYGRTWRATSTPIPPQSSSPPAINLQVVTCPTSRQCLVLGQYAVAGRQSTSPAIALSGFGAAWTVKTLPLLSGPGVSSSYTDMNFSSAVCTTATSCLAVGDDQGSDTEGFIYSLAGSTWGVREAPLPPGSSLAQSGQAVLFGGLACPSSTCLAVGNYNGAVPGTGFISQGSALTWTSSGISPPKSAYPKSALNLAGLACESASFCVATGMYPTADRAGATAFVTGSGTSWHVSTAPSPPADGAKYADVNLFEVACSSSSCVAVGDYFTGAGSKAADEPVVDTLP